MESAASTKADGIPNSTAAGSFCFVSLLGLAKSLACDRCAIEDENFPTR
jgi:hypothetical protein